MGPAWRTEIRRGAVLLLGALAVGAAFGVALPALAAATLGYLGWHLHQLYRFERWLRDGKRFAPPRADGIWGEVFHHYYRLQRRTRERKRRLARLVREFRESTAAIPDGAVVLGEHWQILWFNPAATRLLALRPRDIGQRVVNLVRHPAFAEYVARGDFRLPVSAPSPVEPGRTLSLHLVPYGEAQHLLLARDVTRLQRLEQMRREFVANASHELRSPLTVIAGYLDTLLEDPQLADGLAGPLGAMRTQAERMRAIVDDLLELSRLETETTAAPREPVDVAELLARVRDDALPLRKAGQTLTLELRSDAGLRGVESELRSAVANLVENALAHTPEHGAVAIRWTAGADGARLSVIDDGVGIPAEHIPRLTERFYRVDPGRAREAGGTGLGLSIVKHALQRHDARLEIESTPGAGAAFHCVFPPGRVIDR